ncbi:MAG: S1 RNA-binding domain-containing protein [Anaerolineae bacterium]|nr:S1 RNA-binding domain-containing protein [Anaerolineae bacterium]
MLDEGYWESLLRDAENECDSWRPRSNDSDETFGGWATAEPGSLPKRAAEPPAEDEADWDRASALLESGETVVVTVCGHNRGGLLANLGTIQGFLPASHLVTMPSALNPAQRAAALAARIGESLTVRVVEIDRERRRLILSERLARQNGQVDAILTSLRPGQICRGRITNLCPFGAFVDLGGYEGLIHISELSWSRVGTPEEVVRPGDEVDLLVMEVNPEERKIALSLKRLQPDPWQGVEQRYFVGQVVDAVITNVVNFGAFARLEEGLEGLVHISELAEGNFLHPRNVVREGDRVRARVLLVDGMKRRIALSLRGTDPMAARGPAAARVSV